MYRLPWWFIGEELACQCRKCKFNPWVRKIPWRRKWQPTPVLLPGKSHGLKSLVGYSPWGCKESDTTERLHFHFPLACLGFLLSIYLSPILYLCNGLWQSIVSFILEVPSPSSPSPVPWAYFSHYMALCTVCHSSLLFGCLFFTLISLCLSIYPRLI